MIYVNIDKRVLPFILPIVLIIGWYIITDGLNLIPYYILPSPIDVFNAAYALIINGKLLPK